MNKDKRDKLKLKGWAVGSAEEFLGKPSIDNEFYFRIMPKILEALKEDIETIANHALGDNQCRFADCLLLIDGVNDVLRYDRVTDTLVAKLTISEDSGEIDMGFGGSACLADPDKVKVVEIPLPAFILHNAKTRCQN